jgi:hypothetical protein
MAKIEWIENADGTITVTHEGHTASFKREEWMSDDEVFERAKWELIAIGASLSRDTVADLVLPDNTNGGGDMMAEGKKDKDKVVKNIGQAMAQRSIFAATRRLRELHLDEYKSLVKEERIARGLPAEAPTGKVTIDQKIEKLQQRLDALVKEREAERNA